MLASVGGTLRCGQQGVGHGGVEQVLVQGLQPLPLRLPVGQRGLGLLIVPQLLAQRLGLRRSQLAVHKGVPGAGFFSARWRGRVLGVHGGGSGLGAI